MADRPAESIKISCTHCGEVFFVKASERSSASCPVCDQVVGPPNTGIVRRKERKKSMPGKLSAPTKRSVSTTFMGIPTSNVDLDDNAHGQAPPDFRQPLANSRTEMEFSSIGEDDSGINPSVFDPVAPLAGTSEEATVAIASPSDAHDNAGPPAAIFNKKVTRSRKKTKVKPDSTVPKKDIGEPATLPIPIAAIKNGSDIPGIPKMTKSEAESKFRKNMKTSQLSDRLKKAKREKLNLKSAEVVEEEVTHITKKPSPPPNAQKAVLGALPLKKNSKKPVVTLPKPNAASVPSDESLLTQLQALDKQQISNAGNASENRGSGFIKLPTTDILDVLGTGQFRLRVQDIIYEPVDEKGLTQLIKGGVLLGAEDIAEANGNWMPISEHPVFSELRERMAREAHSLLSKVAPGKVDSAPPAQKPIHPPKLNLPSNISASASSQPRGTMPMFAIPENSPSPSSVAYSIDDIALDKTAVDDSPPAGFLEDDEDNTIEQEFNELPGPSLEIPSSHGAIDLTESELLTDAPKKKSAMSIFLVISLIVGVLIAGLIFANYQGLLDSNTSNKTVELETKTENDKPDTLANKKEVAQKEAVIALNAAPKKVDPKEDDVEAKAPPTEEPTAEKIAEEEPKAEELKEELPPEDKISATNEIASMSSLENAKFVGKAGGKALALIFEKDGSSFLLIPETESGGLKRNLAAQKLCELLECPFAINNIVEITIDAGQLKALGASQTAIRIKDGKIKALVQPISEKSFPISSSSLWRPILRPTMAARKKDVQKWMSKNELTLSNKEFSRQLGGILLRDFLVNDWNRFESKPSHVGIASGKLVDQCSIVAFEARSSGRVKGRFGWTSVFPAEMVEKLKNLDKKSTLELLFPNASTTDKSRFNVFWKQRNSALSRIETLAAKSGKENVLLTK